MPYFTKEPCLTVGRRLFGDSITVYLLDIFIIRCMMVSGLEVEVS